MNTAVQLRRMVRKARSAIRRCTDPKARSWERYGGRGVKVWTVDEVVFATYLMTLDGHDDPCLVLDRVDVDGDYEPGNLRFVTAVESTHNQRREYKPCKECSERFWGRTVEKYCGDACRDKAKKSRREERSRRRSARRRGESKDRVCRRCSRPFVREAGQERYCSDECRASAQTERQRKRRRRSVSSSVEERRRRAKRDRSERRRRREKEAALAALSCGACQMLCERTLGTVKYCFDHDPRRES